MVDAVFIATYCLVLVFTAKTMSSSGFALSRFSIPSFVVLNLVVFAYSGTLLTYFEILSPSGPGSSDDLTVPIFALSASALVLTAAALKLSGHFNTNRSQVPFRMLSTTQLGLMALLIMIGAGVLGLYLAQVTTVALFSTREDMQVARSLMTNDFGGKYHWYSTFMHGVPNFVLFCLFAHWLKARTLGALTFCGTVFVFAAFTATMSVQKAPFLWILLGLYLTHVYQQPHRGYLSGQWLLITATGLLSSVVFFTTFTYVSDSSAALTATFQRVLVGQLTPAFWYLEYFPEKHPFLYGRSFPNPGGLLPFEPYNLTLEIAQWKAPVVGIVGSAPTAFWGEMYANFGIFGALFAPLLVAVVLLFAARLTDRVRPSPVKTGLVVWLALHYSQLAFTGLSHFLFDVRLGAVLVAAAVVQCVDRTAPPARLRPTWAPGVPRRVTTAEPSSARARMTA